jgi:hypothetical protein
MTHRHTASPLNQITTLTGDVQLLVTPPSLTDAIQLHVAPPLFDWRRTASRRATSFAVPLPSWQQFRTLGLLDIVFFTNPMKSAHLTYYDLSIN